jgi:nucleolar complex protein 2
MTKKAAKATRKFAAKGQLKKTIQIRRKHQQFKKKIQDRKGKASGRKPEAAEEDDSEWDVKETGQR